MIILLRTAAWKNFETTVLTIAGYFPMLANAFRGFLNPHILHALSYSRSIWLTCAPCLPGLQDDMHHSAMLFIRKKQLGYRVAMPHIMRLLLPRAYPLLAYIRESFRNESQLRTDEQFPSNTDEDMKYVIRGAIQDPNYHEKAYCQSFHKNLWLDQMKFSELAIQETKGQLNDTLI
jgi:hypothetical protein